MSDYKYVPPSDPLMPNDGRPGPDGTKQESADFSLLFSSGEDNNPYDWFDDIFESIPYDGGLHGGIDPYVIAELIGNYLKDNNITLDELKDEDGQISDPEKRQIAIDYLTIVAQGVVGDGTEDDIPNWSDWYGGQTGDASGEEINEEQQSLYDKYGKEVVDDFEKKYEAIVDKMGEAADDPWGAIEGLITSSTGDCTRTGGPTDDWLRDCVTVGVLYGIPGLPLPPIPGVAGATIGEIEDGLKEVGRTFEDIINGEMTCGAKGNEECTWDEAFDRLGNWVKGKKDDILDTNDDGVIDAKDVTGWLGGILGPVLGGLIYDRVGEELEDIFSVGGDNDVEDEIDEVDCASLGRIQVSANECGGCLQGDGFEVNEEGSCSQVPPGETPCEGTQVRNELTGKCEEPLGFTEGEPCGEGDEAGVYDAEGNCVVTGSVDDNGVSGEITECPEGQVDYNGQCTPIGAPCWPESGDCMTGTVKSNGECTCDTADTVDPEAPAPDCQNNPGATPLECGWVECPEGGFAPTEDECGTEKEVVPGTPSPDSGGGAVGGGGGGSSSQPQGMLTSITADPELLGKVDFPITDYLSGGILSGGAFEDFV